MRRWEYYLIDDCEIIKIHKGTLFGQVILKDAYLNRSRVLKLHGLPDKEVEIDANEQYQKYVEKYKVWQGTLSLAFSPSITTLGSLTEVGSLSLDYSNIQDLGDLKIIHKDIRLRFCPINNIGKLEHVGGKWIFDSKKLKKLYEQRNNSNR